MSEDQEVYKNLDSMSKVIIYAGESFSTTLATLFEQQQNYSPHLGKPNLEEFNASLCKIMAGHYLHVVHVTHQQLATQLRSDLAQLPLAFETCEDS